MKNKKTERKNFPTITTKDFWKDVLISILSTIIFLEILIDNRLLLIDDMSCYSLFFLILMWFNFYCLLTVEDEATKLIRTIRIKKRKKNKQG